MGHLPGLVGEGRIEPRVAVAVDVAPHAGRAVEVAVALDVDEPAALAPLDQERLVFLHLGEGVPDVVAVPVQQVGGVVPLNHPSQCTRWRHSVRATLMRIERGGDHGGAINSATASRHPEPVPAARRESDQRADPQQAAGGRCRRKLGPGGVEDRQAAGGRHEELGFFGAIPPEEHLGGRCCSSAEAAKFGVDAGLPDGGRGGRAGEFGLIVRSQQIAAEPRVENRLWAI